MKHALPLSALLAVSLTSPASAHKLIEPGLQDKIAKGAFTARPAETWNRLGQKEGKYQEIWTIDGDALNRVIFFGGIPAGSPLLKERHKKLDPLPKVTKNMLLPDIPVLFERTYRIFYGSPNFEVGRQEPVNFVGTEGIRFDYRYVDVGDEVERTGEAYGAILNGRLFIVTFEAPSLYYFDRDIEAFRTLVGTIARPH